MRHLPIVLAVALVCGRASAQLETYVVPTGTPPGGGGVRTDEPFAPGGGAVPRFQQVIGPIPFVGRDLQRIAFRLDEGDPTVPGGFAYTLVELRISTTTKSPDALGLDLDANVGADETVVFRGPLILHALGGYAYPNPFDLELPFQTPFPYAGGSLLLDLRVVGPTPPQFYLDGVATLGDEVSSAKLKEGRVTTSTGGLVVELGFSKAAKVTPMSDCGGALGSLQHVGGSGAVGTVLKLAADQGQAAGVVSHLAITSAPIPGWPTCGLFVPGLGEVLIDITPSSLLFLLGGGATWYGTPLVYSIPIPADPNLVGVPLYFQGLFADAGGVAPGEPLRTTTGILLTVGL